MPGSSTTRGWRRDFISRCYNRLIRLAFRTRFSDAQCGFKAITRAATVALVPLVKDNAWFFDTELLILAEKLGYRVFEVPVRWMDDSDSHVRIWSTTVEDLRGLLRVRRNLGGIMNSVAGHGSASAAGKTGMVGNREQDQRTINPPGGAP